MQALGAACCAPNSPYITVVPTPYLARLCPPDTDGVFSRGAGRASTARRPRTRGFRTCREPRQLVRVPVRRRDRRTQVGRRAVRQLWQRRAPRGNQMSSSMASLFDIHRSNTRSSPRARRRPARRGGVACPRRRVWRARSHASVARGAACRFVRHGIDGVHRRADPAPCDA